MKKFLAAIIALIILSMATAFANVSYVGNSNSRKFHYANCTTLKKMNPNNRVTFNSRDEAIKKGYVPCKRCKP